MGNQVASQRSVSSARSSKSSSYLSRRGSHKLSLSSPPSVRESLRSTLGRARDSDVSCSQEDADVDGERIPDDIESEFELAKPIDGKMHRNLCECTHPHTRVDVMSVARSSGKRTLYVDRQLSVQASDADVAAANNDLRTMCYLTTRHQGSLRGKHGHPNVIELLGHFSLINSLHIITKYYELGSLRTMLHTTVQLQETGGKTLPHFRSDASIRNVLRDVFQGVAFIHRSGVAHLDLALDNIYVGLDGKFCVGDFRHARFVGSTNKLQAAPSPARKVYAAPELHSGREIDLLKADAWSLGVVMLMVLTLETPFAEATNKDPKYQLLQLWGLPKLLEDLITERKLAVKIPQDLMVLLSSLLCCNPEHRTSVLETVESCSWLQQYESTAGGESEAQVSAESTTSPRAPVRHRRKLPLLATETTIGNEASSLSATLQAHALFGCNTTVRPEQHLDAYISSPPAHIFLSLPVQQEQTQHYGLQEKLSSDPNWNMTPHTLKHNDSAWSFPQPIQNEGQRQQRYQSDPTMRYHYHQQQHSHRLPCLRIQ